ncbi:MAG: hypothetical protein JNM57_12520 [Cyclobacteriaceae bacterium]|nr:hypothetical protein [Cyclobacteriaceae bacterium]
MKYTIPLSLGLLALPFLLAGQSISTSPYSIYGIGLLQDRSTSFTRSIGGTGIAVRDEHNLNPINPASYGAISSPISHLYEAGFYVDANRFENTSLSESTTTGGMSNLNYWFKMKPWWASSLGIAPFSTVSYSISANRQLGISTADYHFTGSGNVNQLFWGNSFSPIKNLSIGFHASFIFGTITKKETMELTNQSSVLTLENKIATRKFDRDIGLQYKINIAEKKSLIIGAVANTGMSLTGKSKSTLLNEAYDTLTTSATRSKEYTLPGYVGAGLSFQTPRSTIAADLRFENWQDANYADNTITFRDSWKVSAGYAYHGNRQASNYWGLIGLRAGFHAQPYPIAIRGEKFPSWGLSSGISVPLFDGRSSLNLTYLFEQFGTTQSGLALQTSQKVMVDLVIRDIWGARRKFD